jgi:hypothetical protein
VGLAAFAAAGISGGDPIRTGILGFSYDIRTAILPFIFIFNTELLIIGITSWFHLVIVVAAAVIAMLVFASASQNYFLTKNRIWETIALLLIAFTLFRPGFWWDRVFPPLTQMPAINLEQIVGKMNPGSQLRLMLKGEDFDGNEYTKTVMLPVGEGSTGGEKLVEIGIETRNEESKILIDNVVFSSPAEKAGIDFDQEILNIQVPSKRLPKQLMFIPALLLLALIWRLQRGRSGKLKEAT